MCLLCETPMKCIEKPGSMESYRCNNRKHPENQAIYRKIESAFSGLTSWEKLNLYYKSKGEIK